MNTTDVHNPEAGIHGHRGHSARRCPCTDCRAEESRQRKRRGYLQATGRSLFVDAAPIALHVDLMRARGAALNAIAAEAHCNPHTLYLLVADRHERIRRTIADRILAVQIENVIDRRRPVPAIGSTRRLRSLYAARHGLKAIAAETGHGRQLITSVVSGLQQTIGAGSADDIDRAWRTLKDTTGTSARNWHRAMREGWPTPDAWVDDDIDAPEPTAEDLARDALEQALAGKPAPLTKEQQLHVTQVLTERGRSEKAIAAITGRSDRTIGRWRRANGWRAAA